MRQIVSLVKDGHVNYAVLDEEGGELVPFAEILLPYPDRFGLHESALLGSNLINAIGLNGKPARGAKAREIQALPPSADEVDPELAKAQASLDRKRAKNRAYYHRQQEAKKKGEPVSRPVRHRGSPDSPGRTEFHIPGEVVWETVARHPEGSTAKELATHVWNEIYGREGEGPFWVKRTVDNRINAAQEKARKRIEPLPFVRSEERRPGNRGQMSRVLYPLPTAAQPPQPEAEATTPLPEDVVADHEPQPEVAEHLPLPAWAQQTADTSAES